MLCWYLWNLFLQLWIYWMWDWLYLISRSWSRKLTNDMGASWNNQRFICSVINFSLQNIFTILNNFLNLSNKDIINNQTSLLLFIHVLKNYPSVEVVWVVSCRDLDRKLVAIFIVFIAYKCYWTDIQVVDSIIPVLNVHPSPVRSFLLLGRTAKVKHLVDLLLGDLMSKIVWFQCCKVKITVFLEIKVAIKFGIGAK